MADRPRVSLPGRGNRCLFDGGNGELALIETGPSSSLDNLQAGIAQTGHDISELTHALVTHIHLDHAGAAGPLARDNPNLRSSSLPSARRT